MNYIFGESHTMWTDCVSNQNPLTSVMGSTSSSGKYGTVLNVYTLPEYRRHGLCTALLKEMMAEAKAKGIECLDLKATQAGKPVYLKCGFEEAHSTYAEMHLYL